MSTEKSTQNSIDAIDFSHVVNKLITQQGWLRKDAERVCRMYKNYLLLQKKYGKDHLLPPTQEIDEFWHNHILDTAKYHSDCMQIFGRYLHHDPNTVTDKNSYLNAETAFNMMLALYLKEFGENVQQVRAWWKKILAMFKLLFFRPSFTV